jgi:hypothetical protein
MSYVSIVKRHSDADAMRLISSPKDFDDINQLLACW